MKEREKKMAYEKVKSFKFSKDFRSVEIESASNNVVPLDYNKWSHNITFKTTENMTTSEYVVWWIKGFLDGTLQFNNKNNYIQYVINKYIKDYRWANKHNYKSLNYNTFEIENEEEQKDYENALKKAKETEEKIAYAIINETFKKEMLEKKKQNYVLTNGYNFITKLNKRNANYLNNKEKAQVFNGLQKEQLKENFLIKEHNFYFEEI